MKLCNPIKPPVSIFRNDKFGKRDLNGDGDFNDLGEDHTGVDLRPDSDDILASHDGIVTFSGQDQYGGKYIDITNENVKTRYLHNRQNLVSVGQKVTAGDLIGYIGSTGFAKGRHLHFEVWINGVRVDPEKHINFNESESITTQPMTRQNGNCLQFQVKNGGWRSQVIEEIIQAGLYQGTWKENQPNFNRLNPVTPQGGWKPGDWVNYTEIQQPQPQPPAFDENTSLKEEIKKLNEEITKLKEEKTDLEISNRYLTDALIEQKSKIDKFGKEQNKITESNNTFSFDKLFVGIVSGKNPLSNASFVAILSSLSIYLTDLKTVATGEWVSGLSLLTFGVSLLLQFLRNK